MCLLTFIPEYVNPDLDRFANAAFNNPDGFGFAISTGKRILTGHGMNFDQVADQFTELRKSNPGHAMFHFRWATHGSTNINNCHPFFLGDSRLSVVGHNGILPVKMPTGDVRSDTKVFAQDIMPAVGGITALDDDEYFKKLEAWAKGSKLVFLTVDDDAKYDFYILNESDGHWDKDMWWSNHSYEYSRVYSSLGSYGSSYGGWSIESYSGADGDVAMASWDEVGDDKLESRIDEIFEQFDVFTTYISEDKSLIDCYTCKLQETVPASAIVTHCPSCTCCLFCGSWDCTCWDELYEHFDFEPYKRLAEFR